MTTATTTKRKTATDRKPSTKRTAKPKPAETTPAPETPQVSTLRLHAALDDLYGRINARWYGGALPSVALTTIPAGRRNALGWCSRDERWSNADGTTALREVNIAAEHLSRSAAEIAETVMHEAVHVYTQHVGIMDTSRNGKYHNAKYRDAATSHGLTCEQVDGIGWARTGLTPEAREWFETLPDFDAAALDLARAPEKTNRRQGSAFIVFECAACGYKVRATSRSEWGAPEHCGQPMDEQ